MLFTVPELVVEVTARLERSQEAGHSRAKLLSVGLDLVATGQPGNLELCLDCRRSAELKGDVRSQGAMKWMVGE